MVYQTHNNGGPYAFRSVTGIDKGLRERPDGLPYVLPDAALMPDDRLVAWVLAMASQP